MKKLIQSFKLAACLLTAIAGIAACNSSKMHKSNTTKSGSTMEMNMPGTNSNSMKHAVAVLSGVFADTTVTGNVQFDAEPGGKVKMKLQLSIPAKANKSVAVHIHEMGDCGNMAKAAGGHWNPTGAMHGKWGSSSFHSGDIGNVSLDAQGNGTMELETDLWSLGGDVKKNILGRTIMVHGGVDDFTSQPAGNSGPRIGCGVIK